MLNKAILVIDSDTETSHEIVSTLESKDYLVFMSSTSEFAVAMAGKVKPALILVNPAMDGASGLEICMTLHEMDELKNVPIIALTSFEGEMDPRYRSEYGIVDLLRKPFTREELITKTMNTLSMKPPDTGDVTPERRQEAAAREEIPGEKAGRSDRIVVRLQEKKEEKKEETETVRIPEEEPETSGESPESEKIGEREAERPFAAKMPLRRRRSSGSKVSTAVMVAAVVVILGAAGVIVYKMGLIPGMAMKKTVTVTPPRTAQKQPVQKSPAPEQKPQQEVMQEKPIPPAAVSPPAAMSAPSTAQMPEKKQAGKVIYSVQIGAFKNEKNAEVLVKQVREKGYDAFVQTTPKDKEMLHRVLIGKFEDRKEAGKLAEDIRNKENVKAIVTGD